MNATVRKVFLIIGVLVLVMCLWQVIFYQGGAFRTGYNAIADYVNENASKGQGNAEILPRWDTNNTSPAAATFGGLNL